jgi:hypothetical protein
LVQAEFHEAYPNARLLSVEEAIKKKRDENLKWHGCPWSVKCFRWIVDMASQTGVIPTESQTSASRMK